MFANIVLSGGGLAAIAYLGCLQYLQGNREIKNTLKNVLGVSSGAIFALILVLDLSYEETKNWLQGLSEIRINHIHIHSIKILMEKYGLDEGFGIVEVVNSLFSLRNLDENITFRDLAKRFGKNLIVAAANVHNSNIEREPGPYRKSLKIIAKMLGDEFETVDTDSSGIRCQFLCVRTSLCTNKGSVWSYCDSGYDRCIARNARELRMAHVASVVGRSWVAGAWHGFHISFIYHH